MESAIRLTVKGFTEMDYIAVYEICSEEGLQYEQDIEPYFGQQYMVIGLLTTIDALPTVCNAIEDRMAYIDELPKSATVRRIGGAIAEVINPDTHATLDLFDIYNLATSIAVNRNDKLAKRIKTALDNFWNL